MDGRMRRVRMIAENISLAKRLTNWPLSLQISLELRALNAPSRLPSHMLGSLMCRYRCCTNTSSESVLGCDH